MSTRISNDARLLDWTGREDFARVRSEWLQLHRWDTRLSPATVIVLAEVAGRMAHDKNFAWPSIPRLAADLGWSEKTVKRAVAQAIERGWLICERHGFGGSNHYAMAASPTVTASVIDLHEHRVRNFVETRPPSLGSKMTRMVEGSIGVNSDPSLGSKMTPHTGQKCPLIGVNSDPLTLSKNLTSEPDHRTLSQGLSDETVQDRSLGAASASILDIHRLLGEGDETLGARRAANLSEGRLAYLAEQIELEGIVGAATDIQSAIRLALTLESKTNSEVTP